MATELLLLLSEAAQAVRDSQPATSKPGEGLIEPLTETELQVLRLLPASSYVQIAAAVGSALARGDGWAGNDGFRTQCEIGRGTAMDRGVAGTRGQGRGA